MAVETVDRDTGCHMATATEMAVAVDSCYFSIGIGRHVTVNALGQAGLFAANAFMHGAVTLMHQHAHMSATYFVEWRDTGVADRFGHDIAQVVPIRAEIFPGN